MKRVGIIGAMELEVEALKAQMTVKETLNRASMDFYAGTLNNTEVVIVRSGIGKVNAALCAQILIDTFKVSHIINTGVAGSLNAALDIGDILVSKDAVHHDMDVRIFGYAMGQVPGFDVVSFPADETMVRLALETCAEVNPDIKAVAGRVASGDQFISSKEVKDAIIANVAGDCAEMEGASIAHAAYLSKIPFVVIRAISDKADDSAEMDYPTFEREAAKHSANLVAHLIPKL